MNEDSWYDTVMEQKYGVKIDVDWLSGTRRQAAKTRIFKELYGAGSAKSGMLASDIRRFLDGPPEGDYAPMREATLNELDTDAFHPS